MTVYIIYSQFTDDPSIIKGVFTSIDLAQICYDNWDDNYKSIQEIELDKVYDKEVELN